MKSIPREQIDVYSIGQIMKRLNSNLIDLYDKETIEALKERKNELRPEIKVVEKKKRQIEKASAEQVKKLFWSVLNQRNNYIAHKEELRILWMYMAGMQEFEKLKKNKRYETITLINEPNLNKGVCFIGDKGLGKSYYLECMNKTRAIYTDEVIYYVPNRIESQMLSAMEIQKNCLEDKASFKSYVERKTLIIDDLGYEDKTYGYNTLFDIIHTRHKRKLKTHISTNFTPQQLGERYSDIIVDRIKEICNIFVINRTESLRK